MSELNAVDWMSILVALFCFSWPLINESFTVIV